MLFAGLNDVLQPAGFRLKKGEEAFVRPAEGGHNRLTVAIWDYHPLYEFSMAAGIRIDAVEDLFNLCSGILPVAQKLSTTTITQLAHFTQPARFQVSTPEEIAAAIDGLAPVINGKILPFFEKYRDVASLDLALNGGQDPGIDGTVPPWSGLHRVSVAFLAGNPRLDEVAARCAAEIQAFPESQRARLDCLMKEIRARQGR